MLGSWRIRRVSLLVMNGCEIPKKKMITITPRKDMVFYATRRPILKIAKLDG